MTAPFAARGHATTLTALGRTYLGGGRDSAARAALARADALRPDDPATLFELGAAHHRCGKRDEAVSALERTLQLSGGHAGASRLLEKIAEPNKARKNAS